MPLPKKLYMTGVVLFIIMGGLSVMFQGEARDSIQALGGLLCVVFSFLGYRKSKAIAQR